MVITIFPAMAFAQQETAVVNTEGDFTAALAAGSEILLGESFEINAQVKIL